MNIFAPAWAQTADLDLAQKNFSAYLACGNTKSDKDFLSCISSATAPEVPASAVRKLARNLYMGFPASKLHVCDKADKVQPAEKSKDYLYYCFILNGKTAATNQFGYAKFARVQNHPRLLAVYYGLE